MSVQSQIDRIEQNVADTYAVLAGLGATMPTKLHSDNLAQTAQNVKMVAEVHTVTLASDVTGAKEVTLLSGNAFIKKHYNNEWFSVVLIANSPTGATGVVTFNYHGNRVLAGANEGIGFRYTSATAVGTQPLNAAISADGWSQHMRVKSSGNLTQYLAANYVLAAGTYTIILICAEVS